ncbi:MAG: hypothetical protein LJF06_13400 [Gemmatimonadetes bacterium]|nr:hypothetical protein [Gemmatimonadota bacterium]
MPKSPQGVLPSSLDWYVPGSVVSALWGSVMPRLAATVWKGDLVWPPPSAQKQLVHGDMYAYPLTAKAQKDFWTKLAQIAFGSVKVYQSLRKELDSGGQANPRRFSAGQRAAHVVLDYFDPDQQTSHCMRLRVIRAHGYDFVLSSNGLDIFIPENPFEDGGSGNGAESGRAKVLQMYKFRETGKPPIGLPGVPASFPQSGDDILIPIPQLSTPTGAYQVNEDWMKGMANDVAWWISGTAYRGMMAALPRIIACMWYEEVVWPNEPLKVKGKPNPNTTRGRFDTELKELLEERMETVLPADMAIEVVAPSAVDPDALGLPGWKPRDIMIAKEGIWIPRPDEAPGASALLDAIEKGSAGNPVFTDSGPCTQ